MGSWTYQHDPGRAQPGCQDPDGAALSIGSCVESIQVTVAHPDKAAPEGEAICSIHLPTDQVLTAVEMMLRYAGIGLDQAIAHLNSRNQRDPGSPLREFR